MLDKDWDDVIRTNGLLCGGRLVITQSKDENPAVRIERAPRAALVENFVAHKDVEPATDDERESEAYSACGITNVTSTAKFSLRLKEKPRIKVPVH
ncbi:uncharacterized protein MAM_07714 [Metarhizium album ARSEF 1941]|uniref:Uncharacterized protein n=1 Tax=Metarhizium album (strain ARSEF 1941) TaxID=1081103 RepID=A0A0B2WKE7_METAS|nr:uncharacterized protein MAM_07714 [Metarhizium album ARSEF 1941]KHN94398.1 hypothetical protein MAM_07714 [Metarhizium album ARSEF 1941]